MATVAAIGPLGTNNYAFAASEPNGDNNSVDDGAQTTLTMAKFDTKIQRYLLWPVYPHIFGFYWTTLVEATLFFEN